jgi:hypothetical protein
LIFRGGAISKQASSQVAGAALRIEFAARRTDMKKTLAVLFTAGAFALVGCDNRDNELVEQNREATKDTLNQQKEAVDDATAQAKKQAEADADAAKARLEAQQQSAKAQIDADKKKVDANAEAQKEANDAQPKP